MNNKKWVWIFLIIVLILVAFAAGVIYWSFYKAKKVADSALDAAKNSQSVLTPIPSPSPSELKPAATLTMPISDVSGEDLTDIPRFNRAIRSSYEKNDDGSVINIEYYGQASSKEILEFYKSNLPNKDWILRAGSNDALNFSKNEAEISIEIVDEDKLVNITQYKVHWFKIETQPVE